MAIPFLSLKELNKAYTDELKIAFSDFLDRGSYMLSDNVRQFENEFAEFCSVPYCVGVANGLDALELILQSMGLEKGAEVIVPANTYYATILSVLNAGMTPVLVEPDAHTYLIDPANAEKAVTSKTAAILAVNLYGKMCDYDALGSIARKHGLKLITDAAQSHGALYKGSTDCTGADAVAYSFYPTKNLGALSDAGAVVTRDESIARAVRARRNYGSEVRYQFDYLGKNSRLSELQAAFLSIKLRHLSHETRRRRALATRYLSEIKNDRISLPPGETAHEDAWHLFVVRTRDREELKAYLQQHGIGFDVHYPFPPHQQKALGQFNRLSLPVTEEIHKTVLSLPLNGTLSDNDADYIITTLNQF